MAREEVSNDDPEVLEQLEVSVTINEMRLTQSPPKHLTISNPTNPLPSSAPSAASRVPNTGAPATIRAMTISPTTESPPLIITPSPVAARSSSPPKQSTATSLVPSLVPSSPEQLMNPTHQPDVESYSPTLDNDDGTNGIYTDEDTTTNSADGANTSSALDPTYSPPSALSTEALTTTNNSLDTEMTIKPTEYPTSNRLDETDDAESFVPNSPSTLSTKLLIEHHDCTFPNSTSTQAEQHPVEFDLSLQYEEGEVVSVKPNPRPSSLSR